MKQHLPGILAGLLLFTSALAFWIAADCRSWFGIPMIDIYFPDPNERMEDLLESSEDLRKTTEERQKIWFKDGPSHLHYDRVKSGIGPK